MDHKDMRKVDQNYINGRQVFIWTRLKAFWKPTKTWKFGCYFLIRHLVALVLSP